MKRAKDWATSMLDAMPQATNEKLALNAKAVVRTYKVPASHVPYVMVGQTTDTQIVASLEEQRWGRMWNDRADGKGWMPVRPYDGERWGFDNGAWGYHTRGLLFQESRYMERLEQAQTVGVPIVCVLPDKVGKGMHSVEFSMSWLERMPRQWDGTYYLAVQDRCTVQEVEQHISDRRIGGIFLGGTSNFKKTASTWAWMAKHYGLGFHYGRAGTLRKVRYAKLCGASSLDSAFPLWTRQRWDDFVAVVTQPNPQRDLLCESP